MVDYTDICGIATMLSSTFMLECFNWSFIWSSVAGFICSFVIILGLWVRYFPLFYSNTGRTTGWMLIAEVVAMEHADVVAVVDVDAVMDQVLRNMSLKKTLRRDMSMIPTLTLEEMMCHRRRHPIWHK